MKTRSLLTTLAITTLLMIPLFVMTSAAGAESIKIGAIYNLTGGWLR